MYKEKLVYFHVLFETIEIIIWYTDYKLQEVIAEEYII